MSTATILVRLQVNWSEITGIKRAFTYEPELPIDANDLPAVYPVVLGRMLNPIPRTAPGQYIVERQYVYRVYVGPIQMAGTESGDLGAPVDETAISIIDNALDYFVQHPRFDTNASPGTTNELPFIHGDILIQDSGPIIRPVPGGAQGRVIDYTFTIAERRFPATKRLA